MKTAAAILAMNGYRVLAFQKYDNDGLSFPCGKINDGESPKSAAIREALEETGLQVEVAEARDPYIGFDVRGETLVYTYLANIVGGHLVDSASGEGKPLWASIVPVAYGPYWHYNQRVFRHFGIPIPLTGKFHSHLTISAKSESEARRAADLIHGKITVINLLRGDKEQTDCMITHHYVTGLHGLEDEFDIVALLKARAKQLKDCGVEVLRIKLEHEPLDARSNSRDLHLSLDRIYTEIHVKCIVPTKKLSLLISLASEINWHPSKNPFAKREDGRIVQFVNRRFYGKSNLSEIDNEVDKLTFMVEKLVEIEEIKYESAVYDSNEELDGWWMK